MADRVKISAGNSDVKVYPPDHGIRFVTAMGTKVNPLQAFMGWIDPYVDVLTCEQKFGDCQPRLNHQVQLGAMASAKEIAEYVALTKLGIDATLNEGPAQVGGFDPALCPADAPDLRACRVLQVGDVVTSIDRGSGPVEIHVLSELSTALDGAEPGDVVTLTVTPIDKGPQRTVRVELVASPDDAKRTLIGIIARDTRTVDLPFTIDIDTEQIGGPSAGLSFTLALIDALSPGELAPPGGVAVTGTIADDGTVGAIGLVLQKLIAVRQSGVRYFLVPAAQSEADLAEVQRVAGDDVEIIAVRTLDDALAALRRLGGDPIS